MTVKIDVTLPSGSVLEDIDVFSWELTRPTILDRLDPREASIEVDRRLPIQQYSIVKIKDGSDVKFRGYCESNSIDASNGKRTTWDLVGMEGLLNKRYALRYLHKADDPTLEEIITDQITENEVPGLLAMANSAAPPGIAWLDSETIDDSIELDGFGSASFWGFRDLYVLTTQGMKKLTEATEVMLPYATAGYHRDTDNLFIRMTGSGQAWHLHGGLFAENAYDTTVRLGEVENAATLQGDLELDMDEIGDIIADIVNFAGLTLRVRDDDNFTYLDLMAEDGRGSTGGLYTIREGQTGFLSLEKHTSDTPKVHNIIGKGLGEQRYSTEADTSYRGVRVFEILEVNQGFIGEDSMMQKRIDETHEARRVDSQYDIEMHKSYHAYPGDYFKFYPKYASPQVLRAIEIREGSDGITKLSLGNRNINYTDIEDARNSYPRGFTDKYIEVLRDSQTTTGTIHISDASHRVQSADIDGWSFDVPYGVNDEKYHPRITLSITLTAKDSTTGWVTSTAYVTSDQVYNAVSGEIAELYTCKSGHTSGATTEPGVGASWTTYWTQTAEERDTDVGRVTLEATIDDIQIKDAALIGLKMGSAVEVDVTSYITDDEENIFKFWVIMAGDYEPDHTSVSDHPDCSVSVTMNYYKRSYV